MRSVEQSSSGGIEQTIKDESKNDDKSSAAALHNMNLRSETTLDSSTEKVARKDSSSMNL